MALVTLAKSPSQSSVPIFNAMCLTILANTRYHYFNINLIEVIYILGVLLFAKCPICKNS